MARPRHPRCRPAGDRPIPLRASGPEDLRVESRAGTRMLEIRTAAEIVDPELEARWAVRRSAGKAGMRRQVPCLSSSGAPRCRPTSPRLCPTGPRRDPGASAAAADARRAVARPGPAHGRRPPRHRAPAARGRRHRAAGRICSRDVLPEAVAPGTPMTDLVTSALRPRSASTAPGVSRRSSASTLSAPPLAAAPRGGRGEGGSGTGATPSPRHPAGHCPRRSPAGERLPGPATRGPR